ncbi:MAG: helix-turn-helix domain-containing protein [Candidatus Helarchaeota archaeon]
MKKIILQIKNEIPKEFMEIIGFKSLFDYVEKLEVLHIFRYDNYNLIAIQKFKFCCDYKPIDLLKIKEMGIKYIEELAIINENEYICFVKTQKENKFHELISDFDVLLHYPIIFTKNYIKISIISYETQLKSVIDFFSKYTSKENFKILSIMPIKSNINSIYSILSAKQLEIMKYAVQNGYFQIPRKISAEQIAKHYNISISAVHEHLRKAERKIFEVLFRIEI